MRLGGLIDTVFKLGIDGNVSSDLARRIVLSNQILLLLIFAASPFYIVFSYISEPKLANGVLVVISGFLGCIFLNKFKYYFLARFGLILVGILAVVFYSWALGKEAGVQLVLIAFIVLPFVIFEPQKKMLIGIGISIPILILLWLTIYSPLRVHLSFFHTQLVYLTVLSITVIILVLSVIFYYIGEQKAYTELKESKLIQEKIAHQAAYSVLCRGIAHEIKNPLAQLQARAEIVLEKLEDVAAVEKFATVIVKVINRLDRILQAMLGYKETGAESREWFSINRVLDDVAEECVGTIHRKGVVLERVFGEALPEVYANRYFIHQALINLMVNAIGHTDSGGVIRMVSWFEVGKGVVIEIRDTGCGISEENIEKIYDPFFTTGSPTGGQNVGLGLSFVFNTVIANSGKIDVESEIGKGTVFTLTLPTSKTE